MVKKEEKMKANLDALKKKLESLTSNNTNKKNDDLFWRPTIGDHKVRLLVPDTEDGLPSITGHLHYISDSSIACNARNFGEDCEICNTSRILWDTYNEVKKTKLESGELKEADLKNDPDLKPLYAQARMFTSTERNYFIVYVRETEEVKLWSAPKSVTKSIYSFCSKEDYLTDGYPDILDVSSTGRDLVVTYDRKSKNDPRTAEWSIQVGVKQTPLASSKEELKGIMASMPDISELISRADEEKVVELCNKAIESISLDDEGTSVVEEEVKPKPKKKVEAKEVEEDTEDVEEEGEEVKPKIKAKNPKLQAALQELVKEDEELGF